MLGGFISGLIVAGLLSLFKVNIMLIDVVQPFIPQVSLTNAHYYIAFAVIGLIGGAFRR